MALPAIPSPPAGENEYEFYSVALHQIMYPGPSEGFASRVFVLRVMHLLSIGIALLLFVLYLAGGKTSGWKNTMWISKIVIHSGQKYIVTNLLFLTPIFVVINGIFGYYFYTFFGYVYLHEHGQSVMVALFSIATVPLFMQCWVSAFAVLQSSLIVANKADGHWKLSSCPAKLANWCFAAGIAIFGVIMIPIASFFVKEGDRSWKLYAALQYALNDLATSSTVDIKSALDLIPVFQDFLETINRYRIAHVVMFGFALFFCVMTLGVGALSFSLVFVLQSQIKLSQSILSNASDSLGVNQRNSHEISPSTTSTFSIRQNFSDVIRGSDPSNINHVMVLRRAQRDLVAVAVPVVTFCGFFCILCVLIIYNLTRNFEKPVAWKLLEAGITSAGWICSSINIVSTILLCFNSIQKLLLSSSKKKSNPTTYLSTRDNSPTSPDPGWNARESKNIVRNGDVSLSTWEIRLVSEPTFPEPSSVIALA